MKSLQRTNFPVSRSKLKISIKISVLVAVAIALVICAPVIRAATGSPQVIYFIAIGLLGIASLFALVQRKDVVGMRPVGAYMGIMLLFATWLLFTMTWSRATNQHVTDAVLVLSCTALVIFLSISLSLQAVRLAIRLICLGGVAAAIFVISDYSMTGDFRGWTSAISDLYLTISTLIGLVAVCSVAQLLYAQRGRWFWGICSIVSLLGLSLSLARGALLLTFFCIAAILSYVVLQYLFRRKTMLKWFAGVVTMLSILAIFALTILSALQVERTRMRLIRFFSGDELSAGGRGAMWGRSWQAIAEEPFWGYGLGSNGLLSGGSEAGYPHNFVLQVWLDGGAISLILLIALIGLPIVYWLYNHWRELPTSHLGESMALFSMYLFLVFEYAKSYNFYTARNLFIVGICLLFYEVSSRSRHQRDAPGIATISENATYFERAS